MEAGKVFLIGAGPGDPKLVTLKAIECIQEADVVVYDRLVGNKIMGYASKKAEKIYVGKMPDHHTLKQDEISELLVAKAKEGKKVARLKGGDPFVFGRGGEEAQLLVENGIAFEIVPGITSAIAAAAYAGIPVTHRDYASSFHVITGHEDINKGQSSMDWKKIAENEGTLVFLMGMNNIELITQKLIEHGQSPDRPAAVIQWGTRPNQRTVVGTLKDIVQRVNQEGITNPAVILVGEVALLRSELMWLEKKPLWGKRFIVTRSREQASGMTKSLETLGAEVLELPTIRIEKMDDYSLLDRAVSALSSYKWLVFTSVNGVDAFFTRLKQLAKDIRALGEIRICAIGPATKQAIEDRGLMVDFVPQEYIAEAIVDGLKERLQEGDRILLPRAETAREVLVESLNEFGARVDVVPVYRTVTEDSEGEEAVKLINEGKVDWITFTSSSTVKNFMEIIKKYGGADFGRVKVGCIGPVTADTASQLGIKVDITARDYTIKGLIDEIVNSI